MNMNQNQKTKMVILRHKVDYNSWPLEWLANYIEKLQRKTIADKSKAILQNINLIRSKNHYLLQLEEFFRESVTRLSAHMKKEEQYLFPFIREMVQAKELNRRIHWIGFDKIESLIELLNCEHAVEKIRLKSSAEIRENCIAVSNVSSPVRTLFTGLAEFEQACELHIHLQYKFLFPKIIVAKYAVA
jgi:regulator of cell morphogenesis and NO signaling